ncbi:hypothetical protein [Dyadobacter sp. CY356]|uniref:hypothetical protein n=1 Tax=Dyadobacter sp. CY356 TaxID=2906442 RepID=UPI001F274ADF|nr:hypothetical protein [Dyadobacter sp. CY356]MCF0058861.1 hypothetical protein [Dyadobacter sp. CY356]
MKIISALTACATVMLCSCSPYYYSPNKGNIPNIREKNDIRLDAGLGGGLVMRGADVQLAYAPLNHVGIMVNGALTSSISTKESAYVKRRESRSQYLEAALGYFTKLEENTNWVFEVYAGAGKGDYKVFYTIDQTAQIHLDKYFIQPSLSFTHPNKNLEFSIGSRFSGARHSLGYSNLVDGMDRDEYYLRNLQNTLNELSVYWEPTFRFSGGGKNVKGYVSYTPSVAMFNVNSGVDREFVNISLGVRLTMNTSRKK